MADELAIAPELVPAGTDPGRLLAALAAAFPATRRAALTAVTHERLPAVPDPVQALTLAHALLGVHAGHPEVGATLGDDERWRQTLELLGFSRRLGVLVGRDPDLLAALPARAETPAAMAARLAALPVPSDGPALVRHLRRVKTGEYVRLAICDFERLDEFEALTAKISQVADYAVGQALAGAGLAGLPFCVIAMGKWGGLELNYSSDIDLLFVAGDASTAEDLARYHRQAAQVIDLLARGTADGFVFRVDNRLRPEGNVGPLVRPLRQYLQHYRERGRAWEFQALVKARFGGGDAALAAEFIARTRPLVYHPKDKPEEVLVGVREMKAKIESALAREHHQAQNVKLGTGGIRDIEFIIQFLQLHHGSRNDSFRDTGTLAAMRRFQAHRIITEAEHETLSREYVFLRTLEHYLQITHELPVRQLPREPLALRVLARKMGFANQPAGASASDQLLAAYADAIRRTRDIFRSFFDMTIVFLERKAQVRALCPDVDPLLIDNHFSRLESDYFLRFKAPEIAEHLQLMPILSETRRCEVRVAWLPGGERRVSIVAFDYIGEFSIICGLLSAYGQNIISGESYTYTDPEPLAAGAGAAATTGTTAGPSPAADATGEAPRPRAFYRRPGRRYAQHADVARDPYARRRIVCVATVRPAPQRLAQPFSWVQFQRDLEELLGLLEAGRSREASERITLRVINLVKPPKSAAAGQAVLLPLDFRLDNTSDATYSILDIRSVDRFMFLFEFTNVLATRNYYLGKIEIGTIGDEVRDRLFLTTRDGRKIEDPERIRELQVTVTLIKQFATFLPYAPNPHLALRQFSDLVDSVLHAREEGLVPIIEQGDRLTDLARLLGTSTFLWEDFLRMQHEHLLPLLTDARRLNRSHRLGPLRARLRQALAGAADDEQRVAALNRFKDEEMFRIDLRHITRRVRHFHEFCRELSDLADVVMGEAVALALGAAGDHFGVPLPGAWCLCALGKWGGRELGYASDVELMFVWDCPPDDSLRAGEFYEFAMQTLGRVIRSKRDGVFELDLRLRPGGKSAPLAVPLGRFRQYFAVDGGADPFERQALVRLRTVAGADALRAAVEAQRRAFVFGPAPFDLARVRDLRQRQATQLVAPGSVNAKFSPGGLVDAEYFIQTLQIWHGERRADVRDANTWRAAEALRQLGVLREDEYATFQTGYRFLRAMINGLRMVRGHAKDLVIPPPASREFAYLVRRLESFAHAPAAVDAWAFIGDQMARVHALYETLPARAPAKLRAGNWGREKS